MITVLFVVSMTCVILFIPTLFQITTPIPVLHKLGFTYGNSYVFTSSILFQVWFWSTKFNVIS